MRFLKTLLCLVLMILLSAGVLLGCMAADRGAKEISGYFGDNVVFAVEPQKEYYNITLFNEEFRIKRI